MANQKYQQPTGWEPDSLPRNTDALSDWFFFADPLNAERSSQAQIPITIGLRSGDIAGLPQRLEDFLKEVNAKRNSGQIGDIGLAVPAVYLRTDTPRDGKPREQFYTILATRELYALLAEPTTSEDPKHPTRDIFFKMHGVGLPDDAKGVETPLPGITPSTAPPEPCTAITGAASGGSPACLTK